MSCNGYREPVYGDSYFFVMLKAGSGLTEHCRSVIITFSSSQTRTTLIRLLDKLDSPLSGMSRR